MIINLILFTLALGIFFITAYIIHRKRYAKNYIASYRWYARILK